MYIHNYLKALDRVKSFSLQFSKVIGCQILHLINPLGLIYNIAIVIPEFYFLKVISLVLYTLIIWYCKCSLYFHRLHGDPNTNGMHFIRNGTCMVQTVWSGAPACLHKLCD